jgi:hypothetical protein
MTVLIHFLGFLSSVTPASTDLGELVFQDDFERAELQEKGMNPETDGRPIVQNGPKGINK